MHERSLGNRRLKTARSGAFLVGVMAAMVTSVPGFCDETIERLEAVQGQLAQLQGVNDLLMERLAELVSRNNAISSRLEAIENRLPLGDDHLQSILKKAQSQALVYPGSQDVLTVSCPSDYSLVSGYCSAKNLIFLGTVGSEKMIGCSSPFGSSEPGGGFTLTATIYCVALD